MKKKNHIINAIGLTVEKSNGKVGVTFKDHLSSDVDIKVIEGKVIWYREDKIIGIEEAEHIAEKATELSTFWRKFHKGKLPKIEF